MIAQGRLKKRTTAQTKSINNHYGIISRYSDSDYGSPEESTLVPSTDGNVIISFNSNVIYDFYKNIEPTSLTKFKKNYFFETVYMGFIKGTMSKELSGTISAYFNSVGYYRFWLYLHEGLGLFTKESLDKDDQLKAFTDMAKIAIIKNRMTDYITFSFEDSSSNIFGTSAKLFLYKGQANEGSLYQISCPMSDSTTTEKDGFNTGDEISIYITNGTGSKVKVDYEATSKDALDNYTMDVTKINDFSLVDYKTFNISYFDVLTNK